MYCQKLTSLIKSYLQYLDEGKDAMLEIQNRSTIKAKKKKRTL